MKKVFVKAVALTAALSFATVNFAFAGGSIGHGDISVFKNGVLANKLSGQNPIEDGSLLACDGKCMLKSQGISIVAEDKSQIAVSNEADTFKLYVKEGSVDYVINNNTRKIAFYTPQGTYTVAEVVFNASGPSVVKGKVEVSEDGSTEISVTEGRMVFATADGMKAVDANQKIILAVLPGSTVGSMSGIGSFFGAALAGAAVGAGGSSGGSKTPQNALELNNTPIVNGSPDQ
jgi:hypothetical protein